MPSALPIFLDVYALLLGLVTGSYLNVVIYRLPRELSTVLPRSRCPACGSQIRAWDNIPVLSWFLLRGRCRDCRAKISLRYPFIEALTGALFVASVERFGLSFDALVAALFCCLMITLAMIDIDHFLLLDRITLPGVVVGIVAQLWLSGGFLSPWPGLWGGLIGAAVGGGILLAAYGGWWLLRREEGLGLGDVKMLAMMGAFLGWRGVLVSLLVSSLAGSLFGLTMLAVGRGSLRTKIPFGAFLAVGGLVALFFGPALIALYLESAFGLPPLGP